MISDRLKFDCKMMSKNRSYFDSQYVLVVTLFAPQYACNCMSFVTLIFIACRLAGTDRFVVAVGGISLPVEILCLLR